jgi:hypothetical protein
MTEANIRELLDLRHLEHYLETTSENSQCRTFVTAGGCGFTPRSCLVLTPPGITHARQLVAGTLPGPASLPARPDWDREAGELWWERHLVKRFRHDAANQRLLLDTFQGAGWIRCVDNPFRARRVPYPKKCLHRTIESLNEGQVETTRIRFRGDGRGYACWELLASECGDTTGITPETIC